MSTSAEGIWYIPFTPRMSLGIRAQAQYIRPYGRTTTLPIFEKFFMGGEYSVRGFDIRSIGPRDPNTGLVTGGNKTLLFNAGAQRERRRPGARARVLRRRAGAGYRKEIQAVGADSDDRGTADAAC